MQFLTSGRLIQIVPICPLTSYWTSSLLLIVVLLEVIPCCRSVRSRYRRLTSRSNNRETLSAVKRPARSPEYQPSGRLSILPLRFMQDKYAAAIGRSDEKQQRQRETPRVGRGRDRPAPTRAEGRRRTHPSAQGRHHAGGRASFRPGRVPRGQHGDDRRGRRIEEADPLPLHPQQGRDPLRNPRCNDRLVEEFDLGPARCVDESRGEPPRDMR